jgi:DNA-directed RNA polymerase specialized sigma24 family protein
MSANPPLAVRTRGRINSYSARSTVTAAFTGRELASVSLTEGQLDRLMAEYAKATDKQPLREELFLSIYAKAIQAAIGTVMRQGQGEPVQSLADRYIDAARSAAVDVVVKALDRLDQGQTLAGGEIYKWSRNQTADNLKELRGHRRILQERQQEFSQTTDSAMEGLSQESSHAELRDRVALLPEMVQKVISLRFFRGLTLAEAATELQISLDRAFALHHQGLDLLRVGLVA